MANSADPDQFTDLDLHCLQMQSIPGFSRTGVKIFSGMANSVDPDQTAPSDCV